MAVAEISVVPIGTGSPSVSAEVARAVQILRDQSKVKYQLSPMGTVLEGDLDSIMQLAMQMHQAVFESGAARVITTIKIDDRRDKPLSMGGKVESLKKALG